MYHTQGENLINLPDKIIQQKTQQNMQDKLRKYQENEKILVNELMKLKQMIENNQNIIFKKDKEILFLQEKIQHLESVNQNLTIDNEFLNTETIKLRKSATISQNEKIQTVELAIESRDREIAQLKMELAETQAKLNGLKSGGDLQFKYSDMAMEKDMIIKKLQNDIEILEKNAKSDQKLFQKREQEYNYQLDLLKKELEKHKIDSKEQYKKELDLQHFSALLKAKTQEIEEMRKKYHRKIAHLERKMKDREQEFSIATDKIRKELNDLKVECEMVQRENIEIKENYNKMIIENQTYMNTYEDNVFLNEMYC